MWLLFFCDNLIRFDQTKEIILMIIEKQEADYNMIDWWKKVFLKNYANFSGRARRKEFWYFILMEFLIGIVLFVIAMLSSEEFGEDSAAFTASIIIFFGFLLAVFIPHLAVVVRRLHDTGKSGWWWLLGVIPLVSYIGGIILLVYYCTDGDRGSNKYGADPKNPGASDEINEIGRAIE